MEGGSRSLEFRAAALNWRIGGGYQFQGKGISRVWTTCTANQVRVPKGRSDNRKVILAMHRAGEGSLKQTAIKGGGCVHLSKTLALMHSKPVT